MIVIFIVKKNVIQALEVTAVNRELLETAIWIDLISPTKAEEGILEQLLQLEIPTKEEMVEIEPSSRLYKDNANNLFMTTAVLAQSSTIKPILDAITFILTRNQLITIRYIEPRAFQAFISKIHTLDATEYTAAKLLLGLLEAGVDRLADILESVSYKFDALSNSVFRSKLEEKINYKQLLQEIGAAGDLGTKVRESLLSMNRLFSFLEQHLNDSLENPNVHADRIVLQRLRTQIRDATALSDYAYFSLSKVNLLLDATLGMVSIEQNNIIKILSVAATIFLPPTLIASIYGMNFANIPELNWRIGYPIALVLMVISAVLPYRYFKKRKWL
jgi:magnesium transporter